MATPAPAAQIAQALVAFADHGAFPEEDVSSLPIRAEDIPGAIEALAQAKAELEAEIHTINEQTAPDVRTWQQTAQSVQDDIARSKALANAILARAEAEAETETLLQSRSQILAAAQTRSDARNESSGVADIERHADFLVRELGYNARVQEALRGIRDAGRVLDRVEGACAERRILDALRLLEEAWTALDAIPVSKSVRAVKLLALRAFELKEAVHVVFDRVWKALVHVDAVAGRVSIVEARDDEPMSLSDAVIGLKAYKEVGQRAAQLWHDLDNAILAPRMDFARGEFPSIVIEGDVLTRKGTADPGTKALLADLEQILAFLAHRLPPDLVAALSPIMMPELAARVSADWLDAVVPTSLRDMDRFQDAIDTAAAFCAALEALGLAAGVGPLREWAENAPRVWLAKCREAALDSVRAKLAQGLGASKQVERVEKQQISQSEQKELAATGAVAMSDDHGWDAAWSDGQGEGQGKGVSQVQTSGQAGEEGDDDGADAWGWGDEEEAAPEKQDETPTEEKIDDDDDPSEAWGWGDEGNNDETDEPVAHHQPPAAAAAPEQTRELILRETYNISSMPEPVLSLIFAILEDGAVLTQDGYADSPVTTAAAGLFNLPTLALAMFRAVSPYYYSLNNGGSMYLYNDATYIAERLTDFAAAWKKRDNLSARAQSMLRLDNDIKSLQSFAARAYGNEMGVQKTVLRDLLGGGQNLMLQAGKESSVEIAVAHVRATAATWEGILSRSAWCQAAGGLVDAVAAKLIADVMDMPAIGQDEAYAIASLIAAVTELDNLFLPSRFGGEGAGGDGGSDEIPATAQYAASWLRLKYLSEVLQSNLKDLRYLWMEGELSLYFSPEEVIDLINLSFEDNPRTRDVIRQIRQNPRPLGQEEGEGEDDGGW